MKNWKGTTGESTSDGLHVYVDGKRVGQSYIMEFKHDRRGKRIPCFQGEHNAKLFADALNTINKCDLMPSELLKQRDELLEALKYISSANKGDEISFKRKGDQIEHLKQVIGHICNMADKLIKQIEG